MPLAGESSWAAAPSPAYGGGVGGERGYLDEPEHQNLAECSSLNDGHPCT